MANKRIRTTIIATALVACLAIGGISAYFTDGDTATNIFTVGKVEIDLQEPNWNPEDVKKITPQEEFKKDPQVKNIGQNEAYVFVEVKVPCADVKTAGEDGTVTGPTKTPLFTWDVNTTWVEVAKEETATLNTYVYAYGTAGEMTKVAADATTTTVFDYVRFANIIEDEGLEGTKPEIVVNAYAIQSANLNDGDTDINGDNADGKVKAADVWAVVNAQRDTTVLNDKGNEDAQDRIQATP